MRTRLYNIRNFFEISTSRFTPLIFIEGGKWCGIDVTQRAASIPHICFEKTIFYQKTSRLRRDFL